MKNDSTVHISPMRAFAGAFLLLASTAAAETSVGWHDGMYLQPGDAVKLTGQRDPTAQGLVIMSPVPTSSLGGVGLNEAVTFAQSTYDMVKGLSANSAVSLNSLVFSGDVNVSYFGKQSFNANDLTFSYTATRDDGIVKYTRLGFSPIFWSQVTDLQKTLRGEDLDNAVTSMFGTNYVSGYHLQALVSVTYSFHFASAAAKQRWSVSASGVSDLGSFYSFVQNVFSHTNTSISMSYQFYSSDPFLVATNFGFVEAGTIHSAQDYFSNFLPRVQAYTYQARARITEYVLQPFSAVPDYPTYLAMLLPYVPVRIACPDYDVFLQSYTALQARKQKFDRFILNGDTLTWLNSQGRQALQTSWLDAGNYLSVLKSIARGHFSANVPLTVPENVGTYLNASDEIVLPQIFDLKSFVSGKTNFFIGEVDCGCRDLAATLPFANVSERYYEIETGTVTPIYYNPADFEKAAYAGSVDSTLKTFFASQTWHDATNSANPHLNGFFLANRATAEVPNWSLVITGGVDITGEPVIVDERAFTDTAGPTDSPPPCTLSLTNAGASALKQSK